LVISYACQQIIWLGAAMANHIVAVVLVIVVVVGGYDKHQCSIVLLGGFLGGRVVWGPGI